MAPRGRSRTAPGPSAAWVGESASGTSSQVASAEAVVALVRGQGMCASCLEVCQRRLGRVAVARVGLGCCDFDLGHDGCFDGHRLMHQATRATALRGVRRFSAPQLGHRFASAAMGIHPSERRRPGLISYGGGARGGAASSGEYCCTNLRAVDTLVRGRSDRRMALA